METITDEAPVVVDDAGLGAEDIMSRYNSEVTQPEETPEVVKDPRAEPEKPAEQPEKVNPEAEKPQDNDPEPTEPKAKLKWGELKKQAARAAELETLHSQKEKELEELRTKLSSVPQVDVSTLEKKIADKEAALEATEKRLALFDIKESKAYQDEVIKPINEIGALVKELSEGYQTPTEYILDAMRLPNRVDRTRALSEAMDGWNDLDKQEVWQATKQFWDYSKKATEMQENAYELKQELELKRQQDEQEGQRRSAMELTAAQESTKEQILKKLPWLSDQAVSDYVFTAFKEPETAAEKVYNAYAGRALVKVAEKLGATETELRNLRAEVAKRASVAPKAGGDGAPTKKPDTQQQTVEGVDDFSPEAVLARMNLFGIQQ